MLAKTHSSDETTKLASNFTELSFADCQTSAENGNSYGIFMLGYCYEHGIDVEKDENKAFSYYLKSAKMNNPRGTFQVGFCFYHGIGTKMDKRKAFKYYQKSAELNNSNGIFKTAVCYYYGIGVEKNVKKFWEWISKSPSHGKCAHCNKNNTSKAWCLICDPDITVRGWSSRNEKIDDCIKEFQFRTFEYVNVIEWIPFNRLSNIETIGKGGFATVYSATWLDGIRKIDEIEIDNHYSYKKSRESNSIVALKTLASSEENNFDFLKEFKSFMECKLNCSKLAIYGITQNTETNEYLMVYQYANNGNLYKYLRDNFNKLTWMTKLQILKDISEELFYIHNRAGYTHADFHSGNILQDQRNNENMRSYIADLGLSRKNDAYVPEGYIYGVMPYVAPEVLSGNVKFTQAADIYGFGVIMTEVSTGQRPFDGYKFDINLAVMICNGLRPGFASGTPDCYIEFANQCMDSDPQKRPNISKINNVICEWLRNLASDNETEIKKQFLNADKAIKTLQIIPQHHPDHMYTSKIISTQRISNAVKEETYATSKSIKFIEIPSGKCMLK
ncbi:kinase-like domain-containing protein [Gigaspora rosea]|uniref:Kinase-like domain-containing protein n=1 Tax=Gigaspora rosea TaxID=44941 RepID=A0A397W8S3_9GLOM|nr:kinase-like domain-containing protein [Gigaspora rosea]